MDRVIAVHFTTLTFKPAAAVDDDEVLRVLETVGLIVVL
jgi:hypothetical protein